MLYFEADEVCVNNERRFCQVCLSRPGTWRTTLRPENGEDPQEGAVCGWCLLYSEKAQWGHDNREELLRAGQAAVEMAAKHRKAIPELDERARFQPLDAEKFVMGVSFTSRVLVGRLGGRTS